MHAGETMPWNHVINCNQNSPQVDAFLPTGRSRMPAKTALFANNDSS